MRECSQHFLDFLTFIWIASILFYDIDLVRITSHYRIKDKYGHITKHCDYNRLIFAAHHGSGTKFASAFMKKYSAMHNLSTKIADGGRKYDFAEESKSADVFMNWHFYPRYFQNISSKTKVIHFYRNPYRLIQSKFNYHIKGVENDFFNMWSGHQENNPISCDSEFCSPPYVEDLQIEIDRIMDGQNRYRHGAILWTINDTNGIKDALTYESCWEMCNIYWMLKTIYKSKDYNVLNLDLDRVMENPEYHERDIRDFLCGKEIPNIKQIIEDRMKTLGEKFKFIHASEIKEKEKSKQIQILKKIDTVNKVIDETIKMFNLKNLFI